MTAVLGSMFSANAASERRASSPDYDVVSLSEADMDLYLSVMRETVDWFENPDQVLLDQFAEDARNMEAAYKAATDPARAQREGWRPVAFSYPFTTYDEGIAARRNAKDRYIAIKTAINSRFVESDRTRAPTPCGRGGDCGPNPTPLQRALMQREKAARNGDAGLIASNRAEIEDLRRRFRQAIPDPLTACLGR